MMKSELEKEVRAALAEAAERVPVSEVSLPIRGAESRGDGPRRRPALVPALVASLAVLVVVLVSTWALERPRGTERGPTPSPTSPPATERTSPTPSADDSDNLASPMLAFGRGGVLVTPDGNVRLGDSPIVAMASSSYVTVARTADGQVWEYAPWKSEATTELGRGASAGPVLSIDGGSALWIEDSTVGPIAVVQPVEGDAPIRRPLPPGVDCCSTDVVLGMDQHRNLYIGTEHGTWRLALGEDAGDSPAWTSVIGLGDARLESVSADEVIVRRPAGGSGWGTVHPVSSWYTETGRTELADLWFLPRGVVGLTQAGRLILVNSTIETGADPNGVVQPTTRLGRPKFEMGLPDGAHVDGLAPEDDGDFLVDLTSPQGDRGWYRCALTAPTCTLAAALKPDDVTPAS